jgi:hypothetical protein
MVIRWHLWCVFLSFLAIAGTAPGQPKGPQPWWPAQPTPLPFVHPLFSDDMVLQREIQAPIWGWSAPGDTIAVAVDGKGSGTNETRDTYVGFFENRFGEQRVFVYDLKTKVGELRGGDIGWANVVPVRDGKADVVLGKAEGAWLLACWLAATGIG